MKLQLKTSYLVCVVAFVLPLGFDPSATESRQFTFGAQGGFGSAVSILQNCAEGGRRKTVIDYEDFALSASMRQRVDRGADLVLGVRGGWYRTENTRPDLTRGVPHKTSGRYLNPHIGLDYPYVGASLGVLVGEVAVSANDLRLGSGNKGTPSLHVRLGRLDKVYMKAGIGENLPLYSGGGVVEMGLGYQIGSNLHMFSGMSGGPAAGAGFVQQAQLGHSAAPVDVLVSVRVGNRDGTPENATSLGIAYTP